MKLDLNCLCRKFTAAQEEETGSTRHCNPYLLEQVLRPLMAGKTLRLREIDFSQFDSEDVSTLAGYYEELEMQGQKLSQFVGALASLKPAACKVRQFC